jgi:predicted HTH domain antitoxin
MLISGSCHHEHMNPFTIEIPADVIAALRLPRGRVAEELRREFAVFLVKEGLLPRPKARVLAGMERLEFDDLLAQRHVPWEAAIDDVLAEVETAAKILSENKPQ